MLSIKYIDTHFDKQTNGCRLRRSYYHPFLSSGLAMKLPRISADTLHSFENLHDNPHFAQGIRHNNLHNRTNHYQEALKLITALLRKPQGKLVLTVGQH